MYSIKLLQADDELVAELPHDFVARHGLAPGDELILYETAAGWQIALPGTALHEQLRAGLRIMNEHRSVLAKLARS